MRNWILLFAFAFISTVSFSQTCCTGGVPYLGAFRVPSLLHKQIGLNISYSYNQNADLYTARKRIANNSIKRIVSTMLLQSDYGISDKLSISVVLPYIIQSEQLDLSTRIQEITNHGFGDMSLWGTYKSEFGMSILALSMALKIPNGYTDADDPENGIVYPLSFQTGSGSWDFILNIYNDLPIGNEERFHWINQLAIKLNTKGKKFDAHSEYRFGHVVQYFSSGNYQWIVGKSLLDTFFGINFQKRFKDAFQGGYENENTGGEWIFLSCGFNYQYNPRLGVGISGLLPVFRNVNGLQLTTSKQMNLTIGYII